MKKFTAFLLALTILVGCLAFVACDNKDKPTAKLTGVAFKEGTVPAKVKQNQVIDYSTVKLVLTYDNNSKKEIALTDSGVTFEQIDVTTPGTKTLSVTYGEFTISQDIEVEEVINQMINIVSFEYPNGYKYYLAQKGTQSNKETEFYKADEMYKVGSVNGYVCNVLAKAQDLKDLDKEPEYITNLKTTYKLYLNNNEVAQADIGKYLSKVENNVYYFTDKAVGNQFKLAVTLNSGYKTGIAADKRTLTIEFEVVDGYNVYDAQGLSVLDNLDVKSWAKMKETKLAWDEHPLSEYTDVKQVVLHNNITVEKKNLPDSYFWHKGDKATLSWEPSYESALNECTPTHLKGLLEGSIKENYRGEAWEEEGYRNQKALYVSNGIGVNGNYMTLGYKNGLTVEKDKETGKDVIKADNGGIYIVCDFNSSKDTIYNEPHTSFMAYHKHGSENSQGTREVKNVTFIGNSGKTDIVNGPAELMMFQAKLDGIKLDNIIGNKWFCNAELDLGTSVDITNCKFYDSFSQMVFGWYADTINVTNCEMKRSGGPLFILVTKTESEDRDEYKASNTALNIDSVANMNSWLTGAEAWFTINLGAESASMASQLLGLPKIVDNTAGSHFAQVSADYTVKSNAIAVLIPTPGDVFKNTSSIIGKIKVGDTEYGMDDQTFKAIIGSSAEASVAPVFKSGSKDTSGTMGQNVNYGYIAAIPDGKDVISGAAKLLNPTAGIMVPAIIQNWEVLGLQAQPTKEQATEIANKLWTDSWSKQHTDTFGLYINPAPLAEQSGLKHFLMVFGEQTAQQ